MAVSWEKALNLHPSKCWVTQSQLGGLVGLVEGRGEKKNRWKVVRVGIELDHNHYEHTHKHTLTAEPHDELHSIADLDGSKSVDQEGKREDVGSSSYQDEHKTPDDQVHSEGRANGKHLHTNVQEHHRFYGNE